LGCGDIAPCILTSALEEGKWSASCPGRFTPRERAPDIHWLGGWVGLRAGLEALEKRRIPSPPPGIEPLAEGIELCCSIPPSGKG